MWTRIHDHDSKHLSFTISNGFIFRTASWPAPDRTITYVVFYDVLFISYKVKIISHFAICGTHVTKIHLSLVPCNKGIMWLKYIFFVINFGKSLHNTSSQLFMVDYFTPENIKLDILQWHSFVKINPRPQVVFDGSFSTAARFCLFLFLFIFCWILVKL